MKNELSDHPTFASSPAKPASKKNKSPKSSAKKEGRPFSWLGAGPYNATKGESALWVAVITQAMMDALSNARNAEAAYHKSEAIHWLTGNSKDFTDVCLMAGLDPSYIRKKAKKCLAMPVKWRAEPGKGKRYLERRAYRLKIRKQQTEDGDGITRHPHAEQKVSSNVIRGPWSR